jgi:hypothetical protein
MKPIFIPSNLNIEEILENNPPAFTYHKDYFLYIIGTISKMRIAHKEFTHLSYVPLNAQMLQRKVRTYNVYIAYLIEQNVIETDNQYIPGEKSKGYRFCESYRNVEYRMENITKHSLIKRNGDNRAEERQLNQYRYLTKFFNSGLQINYEAAQERLQGLLKAEENRGVDNASERYYARLASLTMPNKGVYNISVDNTVYRFHSILTNLKSELRNYITYNGNRLCSVDVKNAQPFISVLLLNPKFYEKSTEGITLYSLNRKIYQKISSLIHSIIYPSFSISNINSYIMLVKSDESQCSPDFEKYCTLVDKGRLYSYISERYKEKTGIELDVNKPEEKRKLKEAIFTVLFSDNRFIAQPDAAMKRFFHELFPNVYKVFALIKKRGNETLPIILQLIESEIVLNRAARTFCRLYPDVPLFTIHDSLVTIEEYKEKARDILKLEFEQLIGLKPSLSFEMWE